MNKKTKLNELTKELMEKEEVKDVAGLQSLLKDMLKRDVENLLSSELDEELGYDKHDRSTEKDNYINGYSKKHFKKDSGEIYCTNYYSNNIPIVVYTSIK